MKILNKLNGWQRLWILGTVAVQIWGITKWSAWFYPSADHSHEHCENLDVKADWSSGIVCKDWHPLHEIILLDMSVNFWLLVLCLVAYVAAFAVVFIVRWIISGFKK